MNTINYIYIGIILVLVIGFSVYFFYTRKLIRGLLDRLVQSALAWNLERNKFLLDQRTLVDQYRQLANINKALREVSEVKKGKKK